MVRAKVEFCQRQHVYLRAAPAAGSFSATPVTGIVAIFINRFQVFPGQRSANVLTVSPTAAGARPLGVPNTPTPGAANRPLWRSTLFLLAVWNGYPASRFHGCRPDDPFRRRRHVPHTAPERISHRLLAIAATVVIGGANTTVVLSRFVTRSLVYRSTISPHRARCQLIAPASRNVLTSWVPSRP